mmetsp:Transcript_12989/g.34536  ORF Transcript_12989/g.34536 Transcript_12989/m.34536 type:complete len:1051 (+) Transcript_12989:23-3175(+)
MGSPPAAAAAAAPSSAARQGDPVAVDAPDAEVIVGVDQTLLEEELLLEAERLKKQSEEKQNQQQEQQLHTAALSGAEAANGVTPALSADRFHQLNVLLDQTSLYSMFLSEQMETLDQQTANDDAGAEPPSKRKKANGADAEKPGTSNGKTAELLPLMTGGEMRDYQLKGVKWMISLYQNGLNGILADQMGLGKTVQTIGFISHLRSKNVLGPYLIVAPLSTLPNWISEFARWAPSIPAILYHGSKQERAAIRNSKLRIPRSQAVDESFPVICTSYEIVIADRKFLQKYHFKYIVVDEGHRLKNFDCKLVRELRTIPTNNKLLLTGTPLQNNLHELWALLNFLLPEVFANSDTFDEWFNMDRMQEDGKTADEAQLEVVAQLHKVLRPFLLRRIKAEVEKGLPPKTETILRIGMSEMQKKWYAALLQKNMDAVNGGVDRSRLLNVVMQLRKCCNHPYLFEGAEPGPPFTTDEHIVQNSGKMMLLDKLLPKLQKRGSRVLIFSQMTRLLDILEDYCLFKQYQYCRIDGNTSGDDREAGIDAFNAENSEKFIFLLSTRAGGLGINLATADIVVLYDSDWNPQVDLQAMDRAHRIGQKKEVHVYRFCIEDTVEEKVIEKAYQKLQLDALVIQQGRLTEQQASTKTMNKDELLNMVRYGAEKVFAQKDITEITDEDIDAIIAKGEEATRMLNEKMAKYQANARKFTLDGGINPYQYQDEDEQQAVPEELLKSAMAAAWVDPPRRERKKNYNESDMLRGITNSRSAPSKSGPKLPKRPHLHDFQFYNNARLSELYDKDERYITHRWTLEQRAASINRDAQAAAVPGDTQLEPMTADQLTSKDDPPKLTDKEIAEKEKLLAEGFSEWSKKDFQAFVKACERHGRADMPSIAAEIEGKEEKEVKAYSKAFWANVATLSDYDRIIKNIERGEQKIERQKHIVNTLAKKLGQYRNPWRELRVHYGQNRGKSYTEEEDRFLLCKVHQLGYGAWEELKAEVRKSWLFRFDWFLKSRTPQELGRRCDTLIRIVEKELEGDDEDARGGKRKVAAAEAGGAKRGKR